MRWLWIILCFCASPLLAEIVPVQVGEREGATRMVLTLPQDATWDVSRSGNGLRISIAGATGYETAAFEGLTEESRILGASGGLSPDILNVGLRCDCQTNSYVIGGKFLTIDVTAKNQAFAEQTFAGTLGALLQPWHEPLVEPPASLSEETAQTAPEIPANTLDVAVSTGLAQAAYRGFVELREEAASSGRADISTDILENIAIGVDAQLQTITGDTGGLPDPVAFSCTEVSSVLSDAWTDAFSYNLQIGSAHRDVVTDGEVIDDSAVRDLALVLVGHGFGHEAIATLAEYGDQSDLTKAIVYIAEVIDGAAPPAPIGLETCNEQLAFWSFLNDPLNSRAELDPRKLMISYKLLPDMLQKRLEVPFSDALVRAGHVDFQAELQDFRNTAMAAAHTNDETAPPKIDLEQAASARDILRADLTETDLDPAIVTPRSPNTLPLSLLETLRMERRDTPGELVLLDEVLSRHVQEGNHIALLNLLIDSENRLDSNVAKDLTERHLAKSVGAMTDPELVAFAFRETLPNIPDEIALAVRSRLAALDIVPPAKFDDVSFDAPNAEAMSVGGETSNSDPLVLPLPLRAPEGAIPTYAESEELLAGSAAMRNAIETFINDTDDSLN